MTLLWNSVASKEYIIEDLRHRTSLPVGSNQVEITRGGVKYDMTLHIPVPDTVDRSVPGYMLVLMMDGKVTIPASVEPERVVHQSLKRLAIVDGGGIFCGERLHLAEGALVFTRIGGLCEVDGICLLKGGRISFISNRAIHDVVACGKWLVAVLGASVIL
jgi:hypothetical protein